MGAAASEAVAVKFAQRHQIESLEAAYFEAIEQWRKGRSDAANDGRQTN
jgi:hypothetical protein